MTSLVSDIKSISIASKIHHETSSKICLISSSKLMQKIKTQYQPPFFFDGQIIIFFIIKTASKQKGVLGHTRYIQRYQKTTLSGGIHKKTTITHYIEFNQSKKLIMDKEQSPMYTLTHFKKLYIIDCQIVYILLQYFQTLSYFSLSISLL